MQSPAPPSDHPEDADGGSSLFTPSHQSSGIPILSSEGEELLPSSPDKSRVPAEQSVTAAQPTSGPAAAFPSPYGRAAQRGLELPDLDGRVGAEALLELLHQGLHRLLCHLGSCNTSKGTVVKRGLAHHIPTAHTIPSEQRTA